MEEKKDIGRLFDRIAATYDRFNHLLSLNVDRTWRRKAVKMLRKSEHLLDVAVGTADLAMEIVRKDKALEVTGLDLSTEMMKIGEQKVAKAGMSDRISFLEGSALDMPYLDSSFDTVTCAYGVRNFSDLDKGLAEMFRVLKSGGQLLILEFSYPKNALVRAVYDFFFTHFMPLAGRAVSKDKTAYTYFRNSVKGFIWGQEMSDSISAAGFIDVCYKTMTFGITTLYTAVKK